VHCDVDFGGEIGRGAMPVPVGSIPLGLADDAFALQSRVSLLEVEVSDKKQIIRTLKQVLTEAKERERNCLQETVREWEEKVQKQKTHYEASLERQLQLVDRLLNDKTELTKRCELFSEELKAVERKFQMKTQEIDEQNSKNLSRQKQNWMAAEKLRREAWEKDKTREIKEITIKGLQPEVERILAERKQEKLKLDEQHREQMDNQRRELLDLAQTQVREAREMLAKEHEQQLDKEREAHRRKIREEFEKFSAQLQEERSKCAADLLGERRKHEQALQQEVDSFENRLREAVGAERTKADAAIEDVKVNASDTETRHRNELAQLQERLQAEKEQWQQEHAERTRVDFEHREASLREELTKERDRQIDLLVDRLGREHLEQQRTIKNENSAALDQVRAEDAERLRCLSSELEEARSKISAAETERALHQQTIQNLEIAIRDERKQHSDMEARVVQLEVGNAAAQQNAEKATERHQEELWQITELQQRDVEASQKEIARLKACISQGKTRTEEQQKEAKHREEKIISDLEARVKRTLQAKEDTIGELRTRCAASDNKVREFEYLLARQREELLSGLTNQLRS
jgi:5-azacytidine-induced protein 1